MMLDSTFRPKLIFARERQTARCLLLCIDSACLAGGELDAWLDGGDAAMLDSGWPDVLGLGFGCGAEAASDAREFGCVTDAADDDAGGDLSASLDRGDCIGVADLVD